MRKNPAVWFEIYVQDMNRAKKFYESVLQGKLEKLDSPGMDMLAFPMEMNASGASGALVKMQGVPSGGNSTIVYFACEDCSVEEGRVTKSGGGIHKKKSSIGQYGFISLVIDTEGNMFGLHSMK
jgi:predicted enzyme related to lactoylglutathione lyase